MGRSRIRKLETPSETIAPAASAPEKRWKVLDQECFVDRRRLVGDATGSCTTEGPDAPPTVSIVAKWESAVITVIVLVRPLEYRLVRGGEQSDVADVDRFVFGGAQRIRGPPADRFASISSFTQGGRPGLRVR